MDTTADFVSIRRTMKSFYIFFSGQIRSETRIRNVLIGRTTLVNSDNRSRFNWAFATWCDRQRHIVKPISMDVINICRILLIRSNRLPTAFSSLVASRQCSRSAWNARKEGRVVLYRWLLFNFVGIISKLIKKNSADGRLSGSQHSCMVIKWKRGNDRLRMILIKWLTRRAY